jgi:choline-glycine betaine transporter
LLGIGGAGIATGAVTGFMALGVRSDLDKECENRTCKPILESDVGRYQKDIDRYRLLGTISGVSLAAGVAAAATGGVLLLLGGREREKAPETATIQAVPYLGMGELGLLGRF